MDNNAFKSVAFGGFDKQDVIAYIQRTAQEAAEAQEKLRQDNAALQTENESLSSQLATLRYQLETARRRCGELEEALGRETALQEELDALRPQTEALRRESEELRREAEGLRAQAEAYARFQGQIGAIECQARERAADLEDETKRRLRETSEAFRTQYAALMETFASAAAHVNGELRRVEVNLTQLPRALDRSSAELQRLEELLGEQPQGQEP